MHNATIELTPEFIRDSSIDDFGKALRQNIKSKYARAATSFMMAPLTKKERRDNYFLAALLNTIPCSETRH